jgi:hypothetical protein
MLEDCEYMEDISFIDESKLAIGQIKFGVKIGEISEKLECNSRLAFINIRTLENDEFCVSVSQDGYKIVAFQFDTIDDKLSVRDDQLMSFETIDALMNSISKLYIVKFHEELTKKLASLENN